MTLDDALREAVETGRLHEIVLRESFGGWQAIANFHGALMGPWNVGTDEDAAAALLQALRKEPPAAEPPPTSTGAFD